MWKCFNLPKMKSSRSWMISKMTHYFIFLTWLQIVAGSDLSPSNSGSQRTELNCSKTLPQWIGFDDSNYTQGELLENNGMMVYPFDAFGCSGRVMSLQSTENLDIIDLFIENTKGEQTEVMFHNTRLNGFHFYNFEPSEADLPKTVFEAGYKAGIVTRNFFTLNTPGQYFYFKTSQGETVMTDKSVKLNMQIGSEYGLKGWSNLSDCDPTNDVYGAGTNQKHQLCTLIKNGEVVNETLCTEEIHFVRKCNFTPEWVSWAMWSMCDTPDFCGNGSRRRFRTQCNDTSSGNIVDSEKCGNKSVETEHCYEYCPSDYYWNNTYMVLKKNCTAYLPHEQESIAGCGNGFELYIATCYVDVQDPQIVEDERKCGVTAPHQLISCYIPCAGAESQDTRSYQLADIFHDSIEKSTVDSFTPAQLSAEADLTIHGNFDFGDASCPGQLFAFKPNSPVDPYIFEVQFNKLVYLTQFRFVVSNDGTSSYSITFTDVNYKQILIENDLILRETTGFTILSLNNILVSGSRLHLEQNLQECISIRIEGFLAGEWGSWGNWSSCDGDCRNKRVWNRTRDCFKTGDLQDRIDRKYCVGSFIEYDQCKCEELFHWNLQISWGNCTLNNSKTCGNGFKYKVPDECMYNTTELTNHEEEKWRCGEVPIHVRSCYVPCADTCDLVHSPRSYRCESVHLVDPEYSTVIDAYLSTTISLNQTKDEFTLLMKCESQSSEGYIQPNVIINSIIYSSSISLSVLTNDGFNSEVQLTPSLIATTFIFLPHGWMTIFGSSAISNVQIYFASISGCDLPQWKHVPGICNATCEFGAKINGTRNVTVECRGGGSNNDDQLFSNEYCLGQITEKFYLEDCAGDLVCFNYTTWSEFGECGGDCGINGTKNRTRDCFGNGISYPLGNCSHLGEHIQIESCYNDGTPCFEWATWENWSKACNNTTSYRKRACLRDSESGDYLPASPYNCTNIFHESFKQTKIVHNNVSCFEWGNWTSIGCSNDCGTGVETFKRECYHWKLGLLLDSSPCLKLGEKYNTSVCQLAPCSGYSNWTEWSENCTKPCGVGKQYRNRTCYYNNPSFCTLNDVEEKDCNVHDCPVDGELIPWTSWSLCNVSCGSGFNERYRYCMPPRHGGLPCDSVNGSSVEHEHKPCYTSVSCPGIAETSPGESCTDFCASKGLICYNNFNSTNMTHLLINSGIKCGMNSRPQYSEDYDPSVRMGDCAGFENVENYDCDAVPLDKVTSRICNCLSADDIQYGPWQQWGQCDSRCSYGVKERYRQLSDDIVDKTPCKTRICEVDGKWSAWNEFSSCSVTCGAGTKFRTRSCIDPLFGGRQCYGMDTEYVDCGAPAICPVNGGWSNWTKYEECDRPCGGGRRIRHRKCNSPTPEFDGAPCPGNRVEWKPCANHSCSSVRVDLLLEFVDEPFYEEIVRMTSTTSYDFKEKIKRSVRNLYDDHPFDEVNDLRLFIFHSFSEGTGEGINKKIKT
ncbi:uncharacterized protein LOC130629053 isoform X1 [Hydractinia symbiolongicarpus]|uniref:uncharacterized protein LOC130629053 isoform X1 n=2 Tax=Hydractinia symbiolongicarpus TaxID=13093 RepID=UPI00254A79A8|nr:uncharacterized protein LOC130629053 isoform X1 [Hydractinia symbiolongicarpus]